MTELPDGDRALLDLARDLDAPSDHDRARVRAALAARLGAAAGLTAAAAAGLGASAQAAAATGAATAATGAGTGGAAAAGGLGATIAAKLAGAAIVVSMTVGVGATVVHHHRRARLAASAPSEHGPPGGHARPRRAPGAGNLDLGGDPSEEPPRLAPATPVASADRGEVAPLRPASQAVTSAPGRRVEIRRPAEQPGAKQATAATRPERPPTPTVADEARLVHAGVIALRAGQPGRALELFDRHALLYPDGVLSEERDAERALALADLGRVADAAAAIGEFLRAHPGSALGARLRDRQRALDAGRR